MENGGGRDSSSRLNLEHDPAVSVAIKTRIRATAVEHDRKDAFWANFIGEIKMVFL